MVCQLDFPNNPFRQFPKTHYSSPALAGFHHSNWGEAPKFTIFLERSKIMFDIIKKTMLTGVGLAAMTRDKIEEMAKELTEKGEMTEKEGRELVDELVKKSEKAKKDLETKMEGIVEKVLGKMNLATKEDISKLEKRLKRLEKKETAKQ